MVLNKNVLLFVLNLINERTGNAMTFLCKFLWKSLNFIRELVMNIVFLFFVVICATIFVGIHQLNQWQGNKNTKPTLPQKGALYINLNGYLADTRPEDSVRQLVKDAISSSDDVPQQFSIFDLVNAIHHAKNDPKIDGLVLNLSDFTQGNFPAIHYVGDAIADFKQSHKPVIAYAQNYGQHGYLLASYADQIYMNPMGQVGITGLNVENLYFKNLLDKLDVTPHIFRVGTYKSAVEPFMRDNMSQAARNNMQRWLNQTWQDYVNVVAKNRNITTEQVLPSATAYLNDLKRLNGDNTLYAKERHLVTNFANSLTFEKALASKFGENKEGEPNLIGYDAYLKTLPDAMTTDKKAKIAVISVEGSIIDGESRDGQTGGDTIVKQLNEVYHDDNIKGVILRVNSPGGSAFASELIRQMLMQIKAEGKPVVVSMGGMAASGGYWISSGANYIVADPDTLTGSIGIFAMIPTFEKTLHKIGVNADGVSTSDLAKSSMLSGITPINGDILQQEINHGYDRFLTIVSEGRHMSKADVDKIAQGQVWLGRDALKNHLVDELGNFDVAVAKAKSLIVATNDKVTEKDLGVEWVENEDNPTLLSFFKSLDKQGKAAIKAQVTETLGLPKAYIKVTNQINLLDKFNDPKGQYLYCLGCGDIQ